MQYLFSSRDLKELKCYGLPSLYSESICFFISFFHLVSFEEVTKNTNKEVKKL